MGYAPRRCGRNAGVERLPVERGIILALSPRNHRERGIYGAGAFFASDKSAVPDQFELCAGSWRGAAAMEARAILSALWLVSRSGAQSEGVDADLWREILLNGSIALRVG